MDARNFAEWLRELRAKGTISIDTPVIVRHGAGEEGDGDVSTQVSVDTALGNEPSGLWRPSIADREFDTRTLGMVYPVVKRPGNAFDYISVGRTANVDITLPLLQVSKFHAYFSKSREGEYTLADGGSRNGTRIGGRRLEVRVPMPVRSGARISFGPYQFTFFTPTQFADFVATKA